MRATDSIKAANASATTSAAKLDGGIYTLFATATFGGGTVKVQALSNDGSTWIDVANGSLTAAGSAGPLYLPPGQYRINIATATAVYAALTRVPFD